MPIALKPILPRKPMFDLKKFERDVPRVLNEVNNGIERDFRATYPKPRYDKKKASLTKPKSSTSSGDDILRFNVRGTRPHIIRPRRARKLAFQTNYRRKVVKGKIGRRGGGPSGARVFANVVRHPGQKGTDLDKTVAKKQQPILTKKTKEAIEQSANN